VDQSYEIQYNMNSIFFLNSDEGWLTGGNDGIVLHTTDGGETWNDVPTGFSSALNQLYFTDVNEGWAVGINGLVLNTVDAGETWVQQEIGTTKSLRGISFGGNGQACIVGHDGTILLAANVPDAPEAEAEQSVCDDATLSELNAEGTSILWYDSPVGGDNLPLSAALEDGVVYYAALVESGCESEMRTPVLVTVNNNTASTDTHEACESFTWIDGETYTESNNTAVFTIPNAAGCDSIITLDLTIQGPIELSVTTEGETITANISGATYQWLDCESDFEAIDGETEQSFTATANGDYAVEVTVGPCTEVSECVNIFTVSTDFSGEIPARIYPNPTSGILNIEFSDNFGDDTSISLIGLDGKVVQNVLLPPVGQTGIDVGDLPAGVYILKFMRGNAAVFQKVVKY
ncbi:MAG: T9SS type A sorting domain-containing protein, partial [Flavobacteriales bacterium]|nr:T9SS type A sorting domain-containing protein [Flavobacteriales bacterium]